MSSTPPLTQREFIAVTGLAVDTSRSTMSGAVVTIPAWKHRAAAPATIGAAKEVPPVKLPPKPLLLSRTRMFKPGAYRCTV